MTRDEFEKAIKKVGVSSSAEIYFSNKEALLAHDAEQRLVIERQAQQIATLREALQGMLFIFGHNDGYAQVESAKQALKEVEE